jgi:hypothetical protein
LICQFNQTKTTATRKIKQTPHQDGKSNKHRMQEIKLALRRQNNNKTQKKNLIYAQTT